jgi:hypothetical protein
MRVQLPPHSLSTENFMRETRRIVVERRADNSVAYERGIERSPEGRKLLEYILNRFSDTNRFRHYWSVNADWGQG